MKTQTQEAKQVDSKTLFGAQNIVKIEHGGSVYVLRITKDNKLILTK